MAPSLPARKMQGGRRVAAQGGKDRNQAISQAKEIELEDGTKIPVQIPQGMPPVQAQALLEYLKANPEMAKHAHEQAQQMLKTPGMASAFLNMQQNAKNPEAATRYAALKDDPELKHVFEDVVANGPAAMTKYWDDTDLMLKISAKMRSMSVGDAAPRPPAKPPTDLHEAAKRGDIGAAQRMVEEDGADVNAKNERGITPLGVAVGFNQGDMVAYLLGKGAGLEEKDPAGNTVLHYAAGYGRKEVAQQLLAAGADVHATNKAGMTPCDAARTNKETQLVELLEPLTGGTDAGASAVEKASA